MYIKGRRLEERKRQQIRKIKREAESIRQRNCTFHPKLNSFSMKLAEGIAGVPVEDRLISRQEQTEAKNEKIRWV